MNTAAIRLNLAPSLPVVSYGPFKLLEAVPWLMFATALRFLATHWAILAIPLMAFADYCVLVAFVVGLRRMFVIQQVSKRLNDWTTEEQFQAAKALFFRLTLVWMVATFVWFPFATSANWLVFFIGVDGIAFDTYSITSFVKPWCAFNAALAFMMLLQKDAGREALLLPALTELARRAVYMLAAFALLTCFSFGLAYIQEFVRGHVQIVMASDAPFPLRNGLFFLFVFSFASVRLWVNLAVLVFFLRASYSEENNLKAMSRS